MTFDPHSKFMAPVETIISRASFRINILMALAGTNWGQQKESILITYIYIPNSIPIHACSSFDSPTPHHPWFTNSNPTKTLPST